MAKRSDRLVAEMVRVVYVYWRDKYHKRAAPEILPDSKTYGKIRDRLKEGYTVEQLKRAVDGIHHSPHHTGQNPQGAKYLGILVIFRDSDQVEKFISIMDEAEEDKPRLSESEQRTIDAGSRWLESP